MTTNKKKSNKFGITPSVIFLNLTVILLLFIICFFAYNVIKGDDEDVSSVAPFTAVTEKTESSVPETSVSETESNSTSLPSDESSLPPETSEVDITTSAEETETESDITSEDDPPEVSRPDTDFDTEYFDDCLFIGDSISTGLSLYGFLDDNNVFATQGLAPSTVLSIEIDGNTFSDKIASFKPGKIFIMLGTNSVGYTDAEYLVDSMKTLVDSISSICKSEIYVLSIPPITRNAELRQDNYLTIDAINEYNGLLKTTIEGTTATFVDFNSILTASDGYFNEDYAEMDGIHFMGSTYQVMLSYLQKESSR